MVPVCSEFAPSWEKKVKLANLPLLVKKGSTSKSAKSKSAKKGEGAATDAPKVCSKIVPYKKGLLPIGSIIIKSTPSPSAGAILLEGLLWPSPGLHC